jgi:hypothetical protein
VDLVKRVAASKWWKENNRWAVQDALRGGIPRPGPNLTPTDHSVATSPDPAVNCGQGSALGCFVCVKMAGTPPKRTTPTYVTDLEILHYIAHFCTPSTGSINQHTGEEVTLHGRDFCVALLSVVGRFLGTERKKELRAAFKAAKVKSTVGKSKEAREAQSMRMTMRMKGNQLAEFLESL